MRTTGLFILSWGRDIVSELEQGTRSQDVRSKKQEVSNGRMEECANLKMCKFENEKMKE